MNYLFLFVIFSFNFGGGIIVKKDQPTDFSQPLKIIEGDVYYSPYLSFMFSIKKLKIHTDFYYINKIGDIAFSESDTFIIVKPYHITEVFPQFLTSFEKTISSNLKVYLNMGAGFVVWKWKELSYASFYSVKSIKRGASPFVSVGLSLKYRVFNKIDIYIPFTINKILSNGYPLKRLIFYSTSIGLRLSL